MKKILALLALVSTVGGVAHAAEGDVCIGLRGAFAFPTESKMKDPVADNQELKKENTGLVGVGVNYEVNQNFAIGAEFLYGFDVKAKNHKDFTTGTYSKAEHKGEGLAGMAVATFMMPVNDSVKLVFKGQVGAASVSDHAQYTLANPAAGQTNPEKVHVKDKVNFAYGAFAGAQMDLGNFVIEVGYNYLDFGATKKDTKDTLNNTAGTAENVGGHKFFHMHAISAGLGFRL